MAEDIFEKCKKMNEAQDKTKCWVEYTPVKIKGEYRIVEQQMLPIQR